MGLGIIPVHHPPVSLRGCCRSGSKHLRRSLYPVRLPVQRVQFHVANPEPLRQPARQRSLPAPRHTHHNYPRPIHPQPYIPTSRMLLCARQIRFTFRSSAVSCSTYRLILSIPVGAVREPPVPPALVNEELSITRHSGGSRNPVLLLRLTCHISVAKRSQGIPCDLPSLNPHQLDAALRPVDPVHIQKQRRQLLHVSRVRQCTPVHRP